MRMITCCIIKLHLKLVQVLKCNVSLFKWKFKKNAALHIISYSLWWVQHAGRKCGAYDIMLAAL